MNALDALLLLACSMIEPPPTHAEILTAIHQVEASGKLDPPDGDGGKAIGPLQIHQGYWLDAMVYDSIHDGKLGVENGSYQDCRKLAYAKKVVEAYCLRYCKKAWEQCDAEKIARTHNGGPTGSRKKATLPYAVKVAKALKEILAKSRKKESERKST